VKIYGHWTAQGEAFSPNFASERLGWTFHDHVEPGSIGRAGRYKGVPVPYGSAERNCSGSPQELLEGTDTELARIADAAKILRECGAESIVVHFNVNYEAQCNLAFSPRLLLLLGAADIDLTITCYESDDSES
jgi:hypothetical protein